MLTVRYRIETGDSILLRSIDISYFTFSKLLRRKRYDDWHLALGSFDHILQVGRKDLENISVDKSTT